MLVSVQSEERISTIALPAIVGGAHWILDAEGNRLAFAEGRDGVWEIEPVNGILPYTQEKGPIAIDPTQVSVINFERDGVWRCSLVFSPDNEDSLSTSVYRLPDNCDIAIGRSDDNAIMYPNGYVSGKHLVISYHLGKWSVLDPGSANGAFLNGARIATGVSHAASYGDVLTVLDLHIVLGKGILSCNNPNGSLSIDEEILKPLEPPSLVESSERMQVPDKPFFYPALRFARSIESKSFVIDAPPQKEREEKTPLLMRIGPSLVMGLTSLLSACVFISMMSGEGSSMLRAVPMAGMAIAMLVGSVLWPILSDKHQRKEREKNEAIRRSSYSQYLSNAMSKIADEQETQRAILMENRIPVQTCLELARKGDAHLMDRTSLHADYLDVRVGLGDEAFTADIRFPDQRFTMDEDDLREAVNALAREPRVLHNVPLALPLIEKCVIGLVGSQERTDAFLRGIIVQVSALHSYEDVKVVVLCNESDASNWMFASHLPHVFSDDKRMRFYACGMEEIDEIGMFLERTIEERRTQERFDAREANPYYVVICASESVISKAGVVNAIAELRDNLGITLLAAARNMRDLPKQCHLVVGLEGENAYLLDREDSAGEHKPFRPDIELTYEAAADFAYAMSKIQLDLEVERQQIPSRLGFLEMYGLGNVDQMNIPSRWKKSNASATLAACVGVDAQGEPFLLNLHEKVHGPHGLIAGTTGSGKSEFIITYILSMALTYSPDDVSFVLIDYKGGGLAKAFDNEHVRLPHLAGVITNLDGAAISRSLASIQSELKRRQALFNEARNRVGGDNVDIYDYLDLYRQGRLKELGPCPHLFIVADEFAELKQQEPEFMDELISAARIGRSLGVHLILATQKPTGVVNDQIWSNARFKVCLKVADAADSNEMLRRPDAAELQQPGRFYLLVGYNEYYALGQSGYAGTPYVPQERFAQTKDDSVTLISNIGRPLVSVKPRQEGSLSEKRPESVVLLDALQKTASSLGIELRKLWLEPIPAVITADRLAQKYNRPFTEATCCYEIDPIVGEYDDPARQRQGLLTLPLTSAGNALIYGTSDSGCETLLTSLVYSIVRDHTSKCVNVYILDFVSESLRAFSGAPQVGDVIGIGDEEKLHRFFDYVEREFSRRRDAMVPYGGLFEQYIGACDDIPALVVVINDIGVLIESYPQLEDRLARFVQNAGRNGVYLIATAAGSSSIRVKMRQNFRQVLACNLADDTDYGMIFGSMRGIPIPKGYGRGLVRFEEGIFEFQAAHLAGEVGDFDYALEQSRIAADAARSRGETFAPPIPTAPERVSADMLMEQAIPGSMVPYGIYDSTLDVAGFDFEDVPMARCVYQRRKDGVAFLRSFLVAQRGRPEWDIVLLDFSQTIGDTKPEGLAFATRKEGQGKAYLQNLMQRDSRSFGKRTLVIITGIINFLNHQVKDYQTGEDFGGDFKSFLKELRVEKGIGFLLIDASTDNSYAYEDWFKAQLTAKDGLWIGPGVEGQSAIGTSFNARFIPDAEMDSTKGYAITGGAVQLVHLVSEEDEK